MKYPDIYVSVPVGENAFRAVNNVRRSLRINGVPPVEIAMFSLEACSGSYSHCMRTIRKWVNTDMAETAA